MSPTRRSRLNAIRRPSGDHTGEVSRPWVKRFGPRPSGAARKRPASRGMPGHTSTSRRPSGDHRASSASPESSLGRPPLERTTSSPEARPLVPPQARNRPSGDQTTRVSEDPPRAKRRPPAPFAPTTQSSPGTANAIRLPSGSHAGAVGSVGRAICRLREPSALTTKTPSPRATASALPAGDHAGEDELRSRVTFLRPRPSARTVQTSIPFSASSRSPASRNPLWKAIRPPSGDHAGSSSHPRVPTILRRPRPSVRTTHKSTAALMSNRGQRVAVPTNVTDVRASSSDSTGYGRSNLSGGDQYAERELAVRTDQSVKRADESVEFLPPCRVRPPSEVGANALRSADVAGICPLDRVGDDAVTVASLEIEDELGGTSFDLP
jgi:hypothetical protein